jgi:hypothetical protein
MLRASSNGSVKRHLEYMETLFQPQLRETELSRSRSQLESVGSSHRMLPVISKPTANKRVGGISQRL